MNDVVELQDPDYEDLAHLRPAARTIRNQLITEIDRGRDPYQGSIHLDHARTMMDSWLPPGRNRSDLPQDEGNHEERTRARETAEYWRGHSEVVAESMLGLAEQLGQPDPVLWQVTGLLHDLDFLEDPHFSNDVDPDRAHPMGLAQELLRLSVPYVAILAILEHSPHLYFRPTSPLSHALVLADEHATMTGKGMIPFYPEECNELTRCLKSGSTITGYARSDMPFRASWSLAALYTFMRHGTVPDPFDKEGWWP